MPWGCTQGVSLQTEPSNSACRLWHMGHGERKEFLYKSHLPAGFSLPLQQTIPALRVLLHEETV